MDRPLVILLADDDPDFVEINKTILESAGWEVDAVLSSHEVLPQLLRKKYDLLILDLMMEEMDAGFTVAYAVREHPELRDLPILLLTSAEERTGFSFQFDKDKEWMKVDGYAAKPLRPAELIARVRSMVENRSVEHRLSYSQTE
ncbi:MAG: response regulator [candidate division KSB1 bacterium]|nr:response regulator [candidate division KSB1 bacterium]MDZ7345910.1 response regulator [candidate division KSB1 bacterium]